MQKCLILFGILFGILLGMYSGMQKCKQIHSLTCNSSYLYDAFLSTCHQGSIAVCVQFAESLYAFWLVQCPVIHKTWALPVQAPPVVPSSAQADLRDPQDAASHSDADSAADESEDGSYASSSEGISEDVISRLGSHAAAGPRKLGSIASTYWRLERQDRKENLSVIDER